MTKPIHSWLTILEKFYDWWISTRNISLEYHHSLRFKPRNEALTESTMIFLSPRFPAKAMAMVKHRKIFMLTSPFFGERIRCSCRNLRFFGTVSHFTIFRGNAFTYQLPSLKPTVRPWNVMNHHCFTGWYVSLGECITLSIDHGIYLSNTSMASTKEEGQVIILEKFIFHFP